MEDIPFCSLWAEISMLVYLIVPVTTIETVQSSLYMLRLNGAEVNMPKKQSALWLPEKVLIFFSILVEAHWDTQNSFVKHCCRVTDADIYNLTAANTRY